MENAQRDAWVYARRSRVSKDAASISDQDERGQEACREHGWRHAGTLREEVSASRFARKTRGAWEELLRLISAGTVGVLVLWESNRGDRTLTSWSQFLDLCRETKTDIYVISHERLYNLANHRDWKVLASDGVDNTYFSEQLSVTVKRGKAFAMRKGRPAGQTPYGYRVIYSRDAARTAGWEIVDDHARVVREIIERVGKSEPLTHIRDDLNNRSIPSPSGSAWGTTTIRHIAKNPAYAGLVRLADGTYAARQPQEDGAQWPPLVTRGQWEAAREVLASRMVGPREGGVKHMMTGLVKCECGQWVNSSGAHGYACATGHMYVREEWLDAVVRQYICERLARDDARDLFIIDNNPDNERINAEIKTLQERRAKFRSMAARGQIEPDALADIEGEIAPQIAAAERQLRPVAVPPAVAELIDADNAFAAWDGFTIQARRTVIAAVTGITLRRIPRNAPAAVRDDVERVQFDWVPQPPRRGPGGRDGTWRPERRGSGTK